MYPIASGLLLHWEDSQPSEAYERREEGCGRKNHCKYRGRGLTLIYVNVLAIVLFRNLLFLSNILSYKTFFIQQLVDIDNKRTSQVLLDFFPHQLQNVVKTLNVSIVYLSFELEFRFTHLVTFYFYFPENSPNFVSIFARII